MIQERRMQQILKEIEYGYIDYSVHDSEVLDVIKTACKKQIPKKPVNYDNEGNTTPFTDRCPSCYEPVDKKYCECCGQAIDWIEGRR